MNDKELDNLRLKMLETIYPHNYATVRDFISQQQATLEDLRYFESERLIKYVDNEKNTFRLTTLGRVSVENFKIQYEKIAREKGKYRLDIFAITISVIALVVAIAVAIFK